MPHNPMTSLPAAILDALPTPVFVKDADARYVWVNHAYEALVNVRRNDLIGQKDPAQDVPERDSFLTDEPHETVQTIGSNLHVPTRTTVLTFDGATYLIGTVQEVTPANDTDEQNREYDAAQPVKTADTDALTGVLNPHRLADLAPMAFDGHRNRGGALACTLDHIHRIRDAYGSNAGDAALLHFEGIAKSALRDGDLIARLGREAFACLLPGTNGEESFAIAERMRSALEISPLSYDTHQIPLTVSIGVTQAEGGPFDLDTLLTCAERSLRQAKQDGSNRAVMAA